MKHLLCILLFLQFSQPSSAQMQTIGQWNEHLPFNSGKQVDVAGNKIYCATDEALFAYNKDDANLERFTKLTGLNDFGITAIAYCAEYHALVITYNDANIDLLYDDHTVYNLPFIKEKNITGNKSINSIYIKGKLAYLACGFGIVVLDIQRQEVKDTYYLGANGSNVDVLDITIDDINIYAATDSGVYIAPATGSNLADYNNWSVSFSDVNNDGDFNILQTFNGKTYVNYAKPDAVNTGSDELWIYNGGLWTQVIQPDLPTFPKRRSMKVENNELIVVNDFSTSIFDTVLVRKEYFDNTSYSNVQMRDAAKESNGTLWIADHDQGLIKLENNTHTILTPRGPYSAFTAEIAIENGKIWVAHGPRSTTWNPQDYPIDGFSLLTNGDWKSWNKNNTPSMSANNFFSNMNIVIVPGESEHIRVASVTSGILDFNNNTFTYYSNNNSTLESAVGNPGQTIMHGMAHDESGNLWVVNSGVKNTIKVLKNDNTWKTFNNTAYSDFPFAGYILVDQNNFKWVNLFGGGSGGIIGLLVFDDNGTIDNISDDQFKLIPLPAASTPRCMAMDHDGQIWVGTDKGPQVIYSPAAAFTGGATPQQILIKQDNTYQYLLELETVTAIAVDGANRKWLGTATSGLYLLSSDGQEEIHHFTAENSPLFSNNISCISIDPQTGIIYIGTDKGMLSYQSDAIEGGEDCADVLVYPNPVRPDYNGPIAIKGLMNDARIKITDVSGNLVFEAKALGGQAIWNGQNLKGEKAHTGIYLVFASDDAGENSCMTKLLFVK